MKNLRENTDANGITVTSKAWRDKYFASWQRSEILASSFSVIWVILGFCHVFFFLNLVFTFLFCAYYDNNLLVHMSHSPIAWGPFIMKNKLKTEMP